jgi:hypothetical protein
MGGVLGVMVTYIILHDDTNRRNKKSKSTGWLAPTSTRAAGVQTRNQTVQVQYQISMYIQQVPAMN